MKLKIKTLSVSIILTANVAAGMLLVFNSPTVAEEPSSVSVSTPTVKPSPAAESTQEPSVDEIISRLTEVPGVTLDKIEVDDSGNRLLVLIHTSQEVESFVFERKDPPAIFIQFISTQVYAQGEPIQVVGIDPVEEIRYGYTEFYDAAVADREKNKRFPLDYLEIRLKRPVFYHVQQEGWIIVVGLDRTTTKVEVPELSFRFDVAKYEGAAQLPENPRLKDLVEVGINNSRLLQVSREEAVLAKDRVWEAQRSLLPALTARVSATRGREENPFGTEDFEGFEDSAFRRDEYGIQFSQPLYESGRLYGAYRQAKLNKLMANENVRKQAQDLTYEIKKAYYTLLKNQAILRIRRELVAQGEVIKDLTVKKFELKLTSKAEVLNVTAQADQSAYQMAGDEQDVQLARLVLISLLNQSEPVSDPFPGALSFARMSFNVESIIAWAQEHRPDVRIARLNTELSNYNWKAQKADGKIKLNVSGFYGKAGAAFDDDDTNPLEMRTAWNVGLRLSRVFWGNTVRGSYAKENTAPDLGQLFFTDSTQRSLEVGILDALPGKSNSRQAELQYEKAKAEMVELGRKAEFEVRESYYNLEKAARQLEAVREDLVFRQKDLDITREKVKLGLSEYSQLIGAEVAYAQAQVQEQDALAAYSIALGAMDRVAGAEVVRE